MDNYMEENVIFTRGIIRKGECFWHLHLIVQK